MKKFAFVIASLLVLTMFISSCGMSRSDAWRLTGAAVGTAAAISEMSNN